MRNIVRNTRKQLIISIREKFGYIGKVIWTVTVTLASLTCKHLVGLYLQQNKIWTMLVSSI